MYATEFLDADVSFNSVELSLWEEFPKISVKLIEGKIISHAMKTDTAYLEVHPEGVDTLVLFSELMVSMNIKDLLIGKVNVERIRLSEPIINAYVSPSGRANWEIFGEPDTTATTDDQADDMPFELNIERFNIRGPAKISYKSDPDSMNLQLSIGRRLRLRGNITPDIENIRIDRFVATRIGVDFHSYSDSLNMNASVSFDSLAINGILTPDLEKLEINSLVVSNIKLGYLSHSDSMDISASIGGVSIEGKIMLDTAKLELDKIAFSDINVNAELKNDNISARLLLEKAIFDVVENRREYNAKIDAAVWATVEKQTFADSLPLKLSGALLLNPENLFFLGLKEFGLTIANLPELQLNGELTLAEDGIETDLEAKITALPVQRALSLVPAGISDEINKIRTNVTISFDAKVKGKYEFKDNGSLPAVVANFRIPRGHLTYRQSREEEAKIDNIAIDATLNFDPVSPQKTGINVRNIDIQAFAATLKGNLNATNILHDPSVVMQLNGTADLRELLKFAPEDLGITARGNINFKADGSFLLSHLNERDLARNNLIVQVNADRVRLRIPKDTISVMVERTNMELNTTNRRVRRSTGEEVRQITIDFKSDSARVRLPSRETVAFSNVTFAMRSSDDILTADVATVGTSTVIPMSGNFTAGTLEYTALDSSTITLREIKTNLRMRPQRENRALPTIRFDTEVSRLSIRGTEGSRFNVRDASIALTANRNDPNQQRRRQPPTAHQLDSLQRLFPNVERDSLANHARRQRRSSRAAADDFADDDIDIQNTELGAMLRDWALEGSVKSRTGRMVSPMFPLRTRLQNIDLLFTSNDATLQNADITLGESRINLTGKVSNIRRAMNTGRGLTVETVIKSDTLNLNELFAAAMSGAAYAEADDEQKKAIANAKDDDELERIIQAMNEGKEDEAPQLIVVPSNVSIDARLDISNGRYADIIINRLTGGLLMRDRVLQLNDIMAITSMGEINLTALYATRSRTDITLGTDLEFKDIQIEDFISIIPAVDEFAPMLSSFRGIVNAQVAATMSLDSTMDIILPSINASCRIRGKNMVLLDGEEFAEIAKTLRFRNREENLVDSIAVEMLISNNQVQVFPFIMEMDRYRVAISGIQNLDMSFSYHISVLRSPLPFRLGVNVSGTEENMRFRLGRARYRDNNMPTHVTVIDETRINLRSQIDNFMQQGIDAARFSQFAAPVLEQPLGEAGGEMTTQDSLALYRDGMAEFRPVNMDAIEAEEERLRAESQTMPRNRREERNRRRN